MSANGTMAEMLRRILHVRHTEAHFFDRTLGHLDQSRFVKTPYRVHPSRDRYIYINGKLTKDRMLHLQFTQKKKRKKRKKKKSSTQNIIIQKILDEGSVSLSEHLSLWLWREYWVVILKAPQCLYAK